MSGESNSTRKTQDGKLKTRLLITLSRDRAPVHLQNRMKAILLVDHGSRRDEANEMLVSMAELVQSMAGPAIIVRHAHMELAEPSIASGIRSCVDAGATSVTVFPYMLSPGRHSTSDIPRMVADIAPLHPDVSFSVTPPFGIHEKLAEVILGHAGVDVDHLALK